MIKFAFYGRVSTEDQQDPESSRGWQLTRSRALIDARDGVIVAEFFDVDKSRSIPWQRRPQATELLAELKNPNHEFDAVVVGEPHRAFYGNQYGLTFPLFEHYGVPLWVPEVGGPIDPRNEAHDLVMSVFGGMSKGERNRIKIRVKAAMGAQAKNEGQDRVRASYRGNYDRLARVKNRYDPDNTFHVNQNIQPASRSNP